MRKTSRLVLAVALVTLAVAGTSDRKNTAHAALHGVREAPAPGGSRLWGGDQKEAAQALLVDAQGYTYLAGWTRSANFPVHNAYDSTLGGGSDAFLAKFAPGGGSPVYSTYLGGSDLETGLGLAFTPNGDIVLVGETSSQDFPVSSPALQEVHGGGAYDGFLAVFDADTGARLYATYLGGTGWDSVRAVEADASGELILAGFTSSQDFPTVQPVGNYQGRGDGFVSVISQDRLQLLFSTYLGGNERDTINGLTLVAGGVVGVTGTTASPDFPVLQPWQAQCGGCPLASDAFLSVLAMDGSGLVYSTFLGGSGFEDGYAAKADGRGHIYVAGRSDSGDFPTISPLQPGLSGDWDAVLAKFPAQPGQPVFSTYLGGGGWDEGRALAVDTAGSAYLSGYSESLDFPIQNPHQPAAAGAGDGFLAWVREDGGLLAYSSLIGGQAQDAARSIAMVAPGRVWLAGDSASDGFPWQSGGVQGESDAFLARVDGVGPTTADVDLSLDLPDWVGAAPGGLAQVPIAYTNIGSSLAQSVTLTATLPSGLTYLGDTSGVSPQIQGDQVSWSLRDLALLYEEAITLQVLVAPGASMGDSFPLALAVTSAGPEFSPADNQATVDVLATFQVYLPQLR